MCLPANGSSMTRSHREQRHRDFLRVENGTPVVHPGSRTLDTQPKALSNGGLGIPGLELIDPR